MFTNTGLVEHAKKALNENWGYCLGAFGNILTASFLAQKCNQEGGVGTYNSFHREYLLEFMSNRVTDCYGLLKSYIWWNGGNVKYNPAEDRNQETAFNTAVKKGSLSSLPEIPGLILWMKGHAGIYIGGGEFIECAGAPIGMKKGKISNGKVTSGSKFTHWFQDTYITYEEKKPINYVNQLVDRGIIKSPAYWEQQILNVPYLNDLFSNIYAYMVSKNV